MINNLGRKLHVHVQVCKLFEEAQVFKQKQILDLDKTTMLRGLSFFLHFLPKYILDIFVQLIIFYYLTTSLRNRELKILKEQKTLSYHWSYFFTGGAQSLMSL